MYTTPDLSSDESNQEPTPQIEPPEHTPSIPKFKVKVDGQELELSQEELTRDYQMRQSSEKRFQEAARLKQEANEQFEALKFARENPKEFFKVTGVDAKAFAEALLLEELEESLLSPQEKELRELKKFKSKIDQEEQSKKLEKEKFEYSQLEQQQAEQLESEILEVLSANNMKASPQNIAKIAEYLLASLDEQGNRMHAKDAYARVQKNQRADVMEHIASLSPPEVESQFPEFYKSLLKHSASKSAGVPHSPTRQVSQQPSKKQQPESYKDLWNNIKKGN